jgi:hypothetical protein
MSKQLLILSAFLFAGCNPYSASTTTFSPLSASAASPSPTAGTKQIALTWTASSGLPVGYQIEQSLDNTTFSQIQQTGLVVTTTVKGLVAGKTYFFRVRSFNLGGESPYSQTVTVNTGD